MGSLSPLSAVFAAANELIAAAERGQRLARPLPRRASSGCRGAFSGPGLVGYPLKEPDSVVKGPKLAASLTLVIRAFVILVKKKSPECRSADGRSRD